MANFLVPLLSTLCKDQRALWGKLTTICSSGGSPSRSESWLGTGGSKSGAFLTAWHCIALQKKKKIKSYNRPEALDFLLECKHRGPGTTAKSQIPHRLASGLLLSLGPMENGLFPPAFLSHQIQVDQGNTFRVLYNFSRALISFFASPVMIHPAPDFGDVSSIVRWRSRPEELPEKQCLATVELKTKILCPDSACSQSHSPGIKPGRSLPSQLEFWGLWPGGCWWQM